MSNFKHLNNNINNILLSLLENQNLCKLIYYNSDNPYKEPDLDDSASLLFKKIYPLPKLPEVNTEAGSFLNIFFDNFRLPSSSTGVKEGILLFNIICHIDLWRMKEIGMIRPLAILHEIDSIFNNKRIVGVKKLQFDRGRFLYVNENYSGYQAGYQIVSGN